MKNKILVRCDQCFVTQTLEFKNDRPLACEFCGNPLFARVHKVVKGGKSG